MTDTELDELCDLRQSNKDIQAALQTEIDVINTTIGDELGSRGVEKVETARYVPRIVIQERKTLDKTKLVEMGVPVATIEACTVETPVQSLRVDKRKLKP